MQEIKNLLRYIFSFGALLKFVNYQQRSGIFGQSQWPRRLANQNKKKRNYGIHQKWVGRLDASLHAAVLESRVPYLHLQNKTKT